MTSNSVEFDLDASLIDLKIVKLIGIEKSSILFIDKNRNQNTDQSIAKGGILIGH